MVIFEPILFGTQIGEYNPSPCQDELQDNDHDNENNITEPSRK